MWLLRASGGYLCIPYTVSLYRTIPASESRSVLAPALFDPPQFSYLLELYIEERFDSPSPELLSTILLGCARAANPPPALCDLATSMSETLLETRRQRPLYLEDLDLGLDVEYAFCEKWLPVSEYAPCTSKRAGAHVCFVCKLALQYSATLLGSARRRRRRGGKRHDKSKAPP